MKTLRFSSLAPLFGLILALSCQVAKAEASGDKARVVCFGDSITKRGYPAILGDTLKVDAINAGVAGHSSAAGLRRMQKDVIDQKPDVVVVFFGTNDARVDSERVHVPVDRYIENLEKMVDACEKAGAKVVICTLPPIDEKIYYTRHEPELYEAAGGTSKLWGRYRAAAQKIATDRKLPLVDLYGELAKTPEWLSHDGVHPSKKGCVIIAGLIAEEVAPLIEK